MSTRILSSIFVGMFTLGLAASAHADRATTMKVRAANPAVTKAVGGPSVVTIEKGKSGKTDVKLYSWNYLTKEVDKGVSVLGAALAKVRASLPKGATASFQVTNGDGLAGITRGQGIRISVKGTAQNEAKIVHVYRSNKGLGYSVSGDGSVKGSLAAAATVREKGRGHDTARSHVTSFDGQDAIVIATGRDKVPGKSNYWATVKSVRKLAMGRDGAIQHASGDLIPLAKAEVAKFEKATGARVTASKMIGVSNRLQSIAFEDSIANPDPGMKASGTRSRLARVTSLGGGPFANRGVPGGGKLLVTDSPNDNIPTDGK